MQISSVGGAALYTPALVILIYISLNSLRELLQLYQQRVQYLLDPANLVTWLLYGAAILMVTPSLFGALHDMQLSFTSISVFLSWFNLLLYLQR